VDPDDRVASMAARIEYDTHSVANDYAKLLVDTEHDRALGRVQIQTNDITDPCR
jgi:hypothetical protein